MWSLLINAMQISNIFVDTSGWGNLVDSSQNYHQDAVKIYRQIIQNKKKLITTNYIISELSVLLSSPLHIPRVKIIEFINSLKISNHVNIIHVDEYIDSLAWDLFKNRPDKNWSLVDYSSFILMKEKRLTQALTNDHHFEQAGLIRLLKK
ncbi:type II toxin-antitoxin system VapC family toxin [Cyanobacterium stanieri LEGE 03274]|uniref:Type II toxin-antitoxin system VapC family toxin n=2 Tax=Cyanobacterium TaxID=102234 RepID=A0ABR9V1J3_9CHRO|nr:type II toxin-antitoxin system VapC family toxin [Cyanobacterium stanieri LEGE 03274]